MFELPLFPLNTVLFPGTTINLHIFEPRYKEMIGLCIANQEPFGVVLIDEGREALGPLARPHPIGCTAHIVSMEPVGQGRMAIVAVGKDRFRIRRLLYDRSYLVGEVDLFPVESQGDAQALARLQQRLRHRLERYIATFEQAKDVRIRVPGFPRDPLLFAYAATAFLQGVEPQIKQDILATPADVQILKKLNTIFNVEVTLLQMMLDRGQDDEQPQRFSVN